MHRGRRFLPLLRSPVYGHGGVLVAADASTKDGWGAHVGGMGAGLMWEDATKEAIEGSRSRRQTGERVSISPLEMVSQAFLLVMVGVLWGKRVGQVVMRCDNKACCDVVSSGRPRSPAMVKAYEWLKEVEKILGIRVRLEHTGSKENEFADALSHNDTRRIAAAAEVLGVMHVAFPLDLHLPQFNMTLAGLAREAEREVRRALSNLDLVVV